METGMEDMLNVKEAAWRCGRNMETVRRWIWGGKLPAQKLGNQLFINKKDLSFFCREAAILQYNTTIESGMDDEIKDIFHEHRGEIMNTTGIEKKGFLERAIRFRNKIRALGYPGVDAAALVGKSRSGRTHELRQGLR